MATLLLWIDWSAPDVDDKAWNSMLSRARSRSRYRQCELRGTGWRAYSAASRQQEAAVAIHAPQGKLGADLLLLDRADGRQDGSDRSQIAWSEDRLLDGTPTAAIAVDAASRTVTLCRDVMGRRGLVYAPLPNGLLVASGEDILIGHGDVSDVFDEIYLAALLTAMPPGHDQTVYRDIRGVIPGELLRFSEQGRLSRLSPLESDASWRGMTERQIVERFRELLAAAVDDGCRGATRVGITLSAGLDSSAVAALAKSAPSRPPGMRILGVTYGLDGFPEIDERALAAALAEHLGVDQDTFPADDLYTLCDPALRPINPDAPNQTPWREWKERGYRCFVAGGVDVVLTGNGGDQHFRGGADRLADALRYRRLDLFTSELMQVFRAKGALGSLRDSAVRRVVGRPLGRGSQPPGRLAWLRPSYRTILTDRYNDELARLSRFPRPQQAMLLLDAAATQDACAEDWQVQQHGIEFRMPFLDPELVRFTLSLPSYLYQRAGQYKWLLREAMTDLLPDPIRVRPKGFSLLPVLRQTSERQTEIYRQHLQRAAPITERLLDANPRVRNDPSMQSLAEWVQIGLGIWLGRNSRCS